MSYGSHVTHRAKLYLSMTRVASLRKDDMPVIDHPDLRPTPETTWWALYTRHQHEKSVAEMLSLKGFDVFLPLYESTRRWKDRKKLLSLPLFPCYVFVRGGLDRKLQVVTTPGIHMILYCGDRVATIANREIEAIQRAVQGPYRIEPHPFLKCGMRVRVIRGSLEGVQGILLRKKNQCRLILSVDMLAQSAAVEVNAWDVEPCGETDAGNHSQVISPSRNRLIYGNAAQTAAL